MLLVGLLVIIIYSFLVTHHHVTGIDFNGQTFLEAKAKERGVIKHPSGLLYKVISHGDRTNGNKVPITLTSPCDCHYVGKLIDGTIFDSSYKSSSSSSHGAGGSSKPITFAPDQVIQGWTIAMQLMTEGSVWELIIPPHLGYGDKGAPPSIPGGAVLLFTLEIIKVHDIIGSNAKGLAYLESKKKEKDVVTLPSGLLYRVLQAGNNNGRRPSLNTPCELHYTISTIDGKEFDSSYIRGTPMTLAPGQWIRGCKEAMQLMTEGAKWEITVPYELGYPATLTSTTIDEDNDDPISVGSVLIFTLELLKVMNDESHDEL